MIHGKPRPNRGFLMPKMRVCAIMSRHCAVTKKGDSPEIRSEESPFFIDVGFIASQCQVVCA